MWKIVTLAGGVAGAATLSQYPEFTQQYLQRLAGQVDALALVARDFDASALEAGFGREAALDQMTGAPFLEARQTDMRATFARHARLAGPRWPSEQRTRAHGRGGEGVCLEDIVLDRPGELLSG